MKEAEAVLVDVTDSEFSSRQTRASRIFSFIICKCCFEWLVIHFLKKKYDFALILFSVKKCRSCHRVLECF
jgi:hypothetical protein